MIKETKMQESNYKSLNKTLVTNLKRKVKELEESGERLKILFDYAPAGYLLLDLKGTILDINKAGLEIGGYEREELIGKNILKLGVLSRDQSKKVAKAIVMANIPKIIRMFLPTKDIISQKIIKEFEFVIKRKDGRLATVEINLALVKINGKLFFFGTTSNITERKKSEEELKASEEKFREIFENVNDCIAYLDKYGKILNMNKRVKDIFGYNPKEIIGKNFAKLGVIKLKEMPKMFKLFRGAVKKGKEADVAELEIKDKKGNKIPVEASVRLVKKKGEIEGIVAVVRDIRRQKELEKKIEQEKEKYERDIKELKQRIRKQGK